MRDLIGRTLGHYRIAEKIGEGGMGEVYRAHDERLDRDVAIKVLPDAVAQDEDRLARFEREAKLLASLNHQNIATLHGLEEHEGQRFLVMELVEGETLAERLKKGPLPVDDSLEYSRQIAEGLEAAHEQGIIHRDLKPANVILSPMGKVKVLDFGLAKAWQPGGGDADLTHSPTLTGQMTGVGVLLGTAAYMSPEQARGKTVDKRADIWAFGGCLYEMLTGKPLFTGDTVTDVLASVLTKEPDLAALPADTPTSVRRLLSRCLAKDPGERLRSAADAGLDLRDVDAEGPLDGILGGERRRVSLATLASAVAVSLLIGILATWWWAGSRRSVGERFRPARFELPLAKDQRVRVVADDVKVAVSPDGRSIAWIGGSALDRKVFIRSLDDLQVRALSGLEFEETYSAQSPRFSPDGTQLALVDGNTVWTLPVDGGVPNRALRHPTVIWGVQWESTQSLLVVPANSGLRRLRLGDDRLEPVTTLAEERGEVAHERPRLLPGGRGVLMSVGVGNWHDCHIEVVDLASGERHPVIEDASVAEYVDTGHLVFVRDGTTFAVPFDLDRLQTTGPPAPVLSGVQMDPSSGRVGQFAVSSSGVVAHVAEYGVGVSRLGWVDRAGEIEPIGLEAGIYKDFRLGPTASDLVVVRNRNHSIQLELYDLERGVLSSLTTEGSSNASPVWSPDGSRLAYSSNREGQWNLYVTDRRSDRAAMRLTRSSHIQEPYDWSSDGRFIVYGERPGGVDRHDLWLVSPEGNDEPTPFATTEARELWASFSPDSELIAYTVGETGRYEVYIAPVPQPPDNHAAPPLKVSRTGGLQPQWSPSGKELFYLSSDYRSILSVDVASRPNLSVGGEKVVLESIPTALPWTDANFRVAADGERFLVMLPNEDERKQVLVVITDWRNDLRRLGDAK
jgi:Tol biopolymer transport system component